MAALIGFELEIRQILGRVTLWNCGDFGNQRCRRADENADCLYDCLSFRARIDWVTQPQLA